MTEEKVGKERLGSSSIFDSFGATLLLCSIIFLVIVALIAILVFIARRVQLNEKRKAQIKKLKTKVFWNPIIRYLVLNSLKLNISAVIIYNAAEKAQLDVITSTVILLILNGAPIGFYFVLKRN